MILYYYVRDTSQHIYYNKGFIIGGGGFISSSKHNQICANMTLHILK